MKRKLISVFSFLIFFFSFMFTSCLKEKKAVNINQDYINNDGQLEDPEVGGNKRPIVTFKAPTSSKVSPNLGVVVEATDPDGEVENVLLYINNTLVRKEGLAPYEWGIANKGTEDPQLLGLRPGTYQLKAVATDNENVQGTATISVTVENSTDPGTDINYVDGLGKIIRPWRATTSVIKEGESFEVWFKKEGNQEVKSALLRGPYNTVNTSIEVMKGDWIYDRSSNNSYDTKIIVTVPAGSPSERYDLILNTSTGYEISLGAVKVVKNYKNEYYVVHFSDTHTFQKGSDLSLYKVSLIAEISNIINPEMVFITGDNLYFPNDQKVDQFYNGVESKNILGVHDFHAATFIACGNHDWEQGDGDSSLVGKAKHYNKYYGLHYYYFSYNKDRFIIYNNGWGNKGQQNSDAISWINQAGQGNFRLIAAHMKGDTLKDLYNQSNPHLIIAGHNHFLGKDNPHVIAEKPIQYVASSIRDHAPEFNLFLVNSETKSYRTISGATAQVVAIQNPGDKDSPSKYQSKLSLLYDNPNNGTSSENKAVIDNKLNFQLSQARVRFVMPLGFDYRVSQGTIVQTFDGHSFRIVDVNVNADAGKKTEVNIWALN